MSMVARQDGVAGELGGGAAPELAVVGATRDLVASTIRHSPRRTGCRCQGPWCRAVRLEFNEPQDAVRLLQTTRLSELAAR